jgi:hypothetical protein
MRRSGLVICGSAVIAAAFVSNSCAEAPSAPSHNMLHATSTASSMAASSSSAGLLKKVHAATARYHSTTQATKAGYVAASPCVSVPGVGGMGFHWVNDALVDPEFDPLRPEAVLYAPTANGSLKLVAVEYIVIDVGQPAPTFDGHPFDVGGTPVPVDHWSLYSV